MHSTHSTHTPGRFVRFVSVFFTTLFAASCGPNYVDIDDGPGLDEHLNAVSLVPQAQSGLANLPEGRFKIPLTRSTTGHHVVIVEKKGAALTIENELDVNLAAQIRGPVDAFGHFDVTARNARGTPYRLRGELSYLDDVLRFEGSVTITSTVSVTGRTNPLTFAPVEEATLKFVTRDRLQRVQLRLMKNARGQLAYVEPSFDQVVLFEPVAGQQRLAGHYVFSYKSPSPRNSWGSTTDHTSTSVSIVMDPGYAQGLNFGNSWFGSGFVAASALPTWVRDAVGSP